MPNPHDHIPLHRKMGGHVGPQTAADKTQFLAIARAYLDAIERGDMQMPEQLGEMELGGGKYLRMFVIQE